MDEAERKRLEARGYWVGDYAEFLGLTEAERQEVELRLTLLHGIKRLRAAKGLSRRALGKRIGSTESSLTQLESGTTIGVSLDLMFHAFFALGGTVEDLVAPQTKLPEVVAAMPKPSVERAG